MSKLLENLEENPRVNICCSFGYFNILVFDHDSITQPHFHVVDIDTWGKKFHCRILINKPEYYKGETSKLNSLDINLLCTQLDYFKFTKRMIKPQKLWDIIITKWNSHNKQKVKVNKERPYYMELK